MAFTLEQMEAINLTGCNISVAASAGSGKTTVLVERILKRILIDKIPLDRILAMTFTDAAASEMRGRLFTKLNNALSEDKYDHDFIKQQLVLLQKAQISTIHAFCLNIIKENYAYIGFDALRISNIISGEEEERYIVKALDAAIKTYENEESFAPLKQFFSAKVYDTSELKEEILSVSNVLNEVSYENYLKLNKDIYTSHHFSELPPFVFDAIIGMFSDYIKYLRDYLNELMILDPTQTDIFNTRLNYLEIMQEALDHHDYSMFLLQFKGFVSIRYENLKNNEQFKNTKNKLRGLEDYLLSILYDERQIFKDLNDEWQSIELIIKLAHTFNLELEKLKNEYLFMDFNDMESYALKILSEVKEVSDYYKEKYIDIMVDEYQDSSINQDKMLSYISKGDNIFRVGDVKQSIYAFRNALPDLLKNYIDNPHPTDKVIFLQDNFRSNSQIIGFVNVLFERLMNLKTFQSNFSPPDKAIVGNPSVQDESEKCIEFHVVKTDDFDNQVQSDISLEDEEEESSNTIRANYIAQLIVDRLADKRNNWSDFIVLVRANARKIDLKKAFEKLNIPNFIDSKEGFYKASAISDVTTYLSTIIHPYVDLNFVALCLSPFYALSDDFIATTKIKMREQNYKNFYTYALEANDSSLNKILNDLIEIKKITGIRNKLIYIYQINHFYDLKTTSNDRTNLDLLLDKACDYESKNAGGIEGFSSFIDSLKEFKSAEALSINNNEDVVRVMSIHQSKGLQFKYVIYWGKEHASSFFSSKILKSTTLGLSMDHLDLENRVERKSILRTTLKHLSDKSEIEEEIRIIYVALTRAKNKLMLVTCFKSKAFDALKTNSIFAYDLLTSGSFIKLLLNEAFQLDKFVDIYEVSDYLDIDILPPININNFTLSPLPDYPSSQIKISPSTHDEILMPLITDNKSASLGTLSHQILETIDINLEYNINELKAIAKNIDEKYLEEINYENIIAFINHPKTKGFKNKTLKREYSFIYQNSEAQMIVGIIDLLVEDESGITIVDYKSDSSKDQRAFINTYATQINSYKKAMKLYYPTKIIKGYIYSLVLKDYIEIGE